MARGQRFAQAGAFAVGAGESVVDVDPVGLDAEPEQGVALGGEVLLLGGAACVANEKRRHGALQKGDPAIAAGATVPTPRRIHAQGQRAWAMTGPSPLGKGLRLRRCKP